jgi:hypothetical protein
MSKASAIQTYSGRRVSPFAPEPGDIEIEDISHALSHLCRFGGHCRTFYSVAQHCCVVADAVEAAGGDAETALAALLHDASEAYLGDLPHPLKHRSPLGEHYRAIEAPLQRAIHERFSLPRETSPLVKQLDRAALAAERSLLMRPADDDWWPELDGVTALDVRIELWPPERAAAEFMSRYARLEATR